jgi:hypothetical protein
MQSGKCWDRLGIDAAVGVERPSMVDSVEE